MSILNFLRAKKYTDQVTGGLAETLFNVESVSYTRNLFNPLNFLTDSELSGSTGEVISASGAGVSDFIAVDSGKSIYFSNNGASLVAYKLYFIYEYDTRKKYIKRVNASTAGYLYVVPDNVRYIRVCIHESVFNAFQAEYNQITSYISRYPLVKDKLNGILSSDLSDNPLENILPNPGFMSIFLNVGCIGDSLASGCSVYKDGESSIGVDLYQYSWGQYLARITGNKYYNWSAGGKTTATWLASAYATECFDGLHLCEAYIIGLGQNDKNIDAVIGTSEDIDISNYNNNADTYYGRYAKIIQKIKEVQPKAKIFICTDPLDLVENAGYNTAVRTISTMFSNVYLLDFFNYGTNLYITGLLGVNRRYAHYNAVGYYIIALIMATYIDWYIRKYPEEFLEVEFIGTGYSYY